MRGDGAEFRHAEVEMREQTRKWAKRRSGWSVGHDECGGLKVERKQPCSCIGWMRDSGAESMAHALGF